VCDNGDDGAKAGFLPGTVKVEDFVQVPVKKPAFYPHRGSGGR
jgi:hypothetical protein